MEDPPLRIYVLGRVAVEAAGRLLLAEWQLRGRQGRLAFAYLAVNRSVPVPRLELATLLWPDGAPPAWDAALSAILSRLRRLLPVEVAELTSGPGQCQLLTPPNCWVDIDVATSAIDAAEAAIRRRDFNSAFGPAALAATLARRPFLAGIRNDWADRQRARLRRLHLRALDCLAEVWLDCGEPPLAVEAASEAISLDRLRERSYQLLMRAHAAAGHPSEAIRAFHILREGLAEELGTNPSAQTQQLFQALIL